MRLLSSLFAVVVLALPSLPAMAAPKPFKAPEHHVPGHALLQFADVIDDDNIAAELKLLAERHDLRVELVRKVALGWWLVDLRDERGVDIPDEAETVALIARLVDDEALRHAETERWAKALFAINDEHQALMWPLDLARLRTAWDDERGATAQRIAVVDTGVLSAHEDLAGRIATGFDFISDFNQQNYANDGNGRDADFNDAGDGCNGGDDSFHGNHVAGTIVANANNGIGTAGVNHNAKLIVVRALGKCGGTSTDIMEGALWSAGGSVPGVTSIAASNRAKIVNLSLGIAGFACTAFEQQQVDAINALGSVVVAAAGNDGGNINSPASCNNVIAVGAQLRNGAKASYTSSGTGLGGDITIYGPGGLVTPETDGVLSTLGPDANTYGFFQGTSMASPHIAGILSLLLAKDPNLTRAQLVSRLQTTGAACSGCGGKIAVNAQAALAATTRRDLIDPDPVDPGVSEGDIEPNDTQGQARRAACGSTWSGTANANNQDWFRVDLAPGPLTVNLDVGNADLDLYLYRGGTSPIARSDQVGALDESITFDVTTTERLEILVVPFETASGPYTVSLTCTPAPTTNPGEGEGEGEGEGPVGEGEGEGENPGEGEGENPGEGEGENPVGEGEGENPGEGEGENPGEGEGEGENPVGEGEGEGEPGTPVIPGDDAELPTAGGTCSSTSMSSSLPLLTLGLALLRRRRRC